MRFIDFRSDTITQPTEEMRLAMYNAVVGDDVYDEDETVKKLEAMAAEMVNKEAALFVPSGTMGNQLAVMTHTKRGDEVIAGDSSHVVIYEVGAAAVLSGVTMRTAKSVNGAVSPGDVRRLVRGINIHHPDTGLICVENATSSGTLMPLEDMADIYSFARQKGIPVHLDGARLFNAALSLGVEASGIARYADSVMFCLSKGLCAPVGSILAGNSDFIGKARRNRKLLGGGMRQAGILAAAGIIALEKMVGRLSQDHANARLLGEGLAGLPGITVDVSNIHINMVFADISQTGKDSGWLVGELLKKGIKVNDSAPLRFVTSHEVDRADIELTLRTIKELI